MFGICCPSRCGGIVGVALYLGSMLLLLPPSLRKAVPTALVACVVVIVGHFGGESQADDTEVNLIAAPSYATHTQLVASQPVSGYGAIPEAIPAPMLSTPVDYRLDVGSAKIIVTKFAGLGPLTPTSLPAFYGHEQTTSDQAVRILRKPPIVSVGRHCVVVPHLRR
jgi:hypothetical protein